MSAQPPVPADPEHGPVDPRLAGLVEPAGSAAESATTTATGTALDPDADLRTFGYRPELRRSVATVDLIIYGLIFMVPIAPWAIFGTVYNASEGMVPRVYLVGLIAMIFTALAYAQMAKEFPLAGSVYAYVGRGLHRVVGFFAGWSILLDYRTRCCWCPG